MATSLSHYVLRSVRGGDIVLARLRDTTVKEREAQVNEAQLDAALMHALDDERGRRSLAAFLESVGCGRAKNLAADTPLLLETLDRALRGRQIVAYELPRRRIIMQVDQPAEVLGPEAEPTSWIEILLVDDDGNPVVEEPYKIEDPAGRIWKGTTNVNGMARIEGIDPGNCKVSFPALPPEWKKAG